MAINHAKLGGTNLAFVQERRGAVLLEESGPLLSSRHEESCFPSIHPSIHGGFTLMRDGDAAWRFRFIESSLGRCNGTRNASLLRVSLVSSPPARLSSALSSSRAHLPHAPHLHTATDERATPADRFPSGSKQTRVDDGDDDDDNGTRIFVSWTPALVFFFFCVASPSVPPPLLAFSKRRSNRLPFQRAIYEAGHAEFLNYSQVPVKFVGGSRPFVRPTRGEPFFIILRRVHRNAPRFVTVEE